MSSVKELKISLQSASESNEPLVFKVDDDFFSALGQEEIKGGEMEVRISAKQKSPAVYHVDYEIEGTVVVACDRCLDDLRLPVAGADGINVSTDSPSELDDEEMKYAEAKSRTYDMAWEVYELAALSLPSARVHAEGECNSEMMAKLREHTPAEDDEYTNI